MSQSLYQEAIAEAKQLREVAEQNAKNAIIEAITPKIRHFIEKQLLESDHQTDDDDADFLEEAVEDLMEDITEEDEVELNETAISMLMNLVGPDENLSKLISQVKSRTVVANALSESVDNLNDDDKEKLLKIAKDLKVTAENLNSNNIVTVTDENLDTQNLEEQNEMSINETNETLYEVDLDEIAALLAEELDEDLDELDLVVGADDLDALGLDADAVEDLDLSALDVDVSLADDLVADDEGGEEEEVELDLDVEDDEGGEEEGEEEEMALDEVFEIDPDMLREELANIALAEAKELAKMKGIKNDMESHFGGKGSAGAGLNAAYGGKDGGGDDFGGGKQEGDPLSVKMNKLSETVKNERRRNRSLNNKLDEYRSAIETLREQLTEMNLFNAKLLYVNKLLQNKHIVPSQRKSIIGALDDARSLREVKLLYKSLTESIQKPKSAGRLSESASRRTLGSSSRTVQSASSSTKAESEVGRWAKLAGIK